MARARWRPASRWPAPGCALSRRTVRFRLTLLYSGALPRGRRRPARHHLPPGRQLHHDGAVREQQERRARSPSAGSHAGRRRSARSSRPALRRSNSCRSPASSAAQATAQHARRPASAAHPVRHRARPSWRCWPSCSAGSWPVGCCDRCARWQPQPSRSPNQPARTARPAGPSDEIKDLADTIDGLLARLETAFDAQRHFVANASHELRTPLTLNRALLEVALADPDATADDLRSHSRRAHGSGEQQERLIEALLTLATSERGLDRKEPFDLAAAAEQALAPHRRRSRTATDWR